jgi:hypothetical protein
VVLTCPGRLKLFFCNVIPKFTIQMGIMVTSMSVRCPQCFYENEERYRFCGMCGIALPRIGAGSEPEIKVGRPATAAINSRPEPAIPASAPVREPALEKDRAPTPVTGMSFLGLSQDQNPYPDRSLDYLLEEEPQPGRTRTYIALILLLAAVGMLGWRWRHGGFLSRPHPTVATAPITSDSNSPDNSATPAPAPANAAPVSPPAQTAHGPQESDLPAGGASGSEAAKPAQPVQNDEATSGANSDGSSTPPTDASSTEAAKPVPVEKPRAVPAAIAKALPKATRATAPSSVSAVPEQDPIEAQGEKYLYGSGGVPQNCVLAQRSLLESAQRANPKAQSVLGTMYATGHCVGRDLPTAYRWFAKASHQDPNNARITRDLEVLWKQMTAGERQLAVSNRE